MGGTLPIHVILDSSDVHRYADVELPSHWKRVSVPSGTPLGGIFKRVFEKYPNEAYYGMVSPYNAVDLPFLKFTQSADDVVPETKGWDFIMAEACQPDKIVWGRDDLQNERLPVHPFIGGDLVRKLGWWAAPGLKHWYVDNVWKHIADALNCGIYLPDVKMIHWHYIIGRAAIDRTYREQPCHEDDERVYKQFMANQFPALIKSLLPQGG